MALERRGLYQNAAQRLLSHPWGRKIVDALELEPTDTGVQEAIEEVAALLLSGVIDLYEPLQINWHGEGAAIEILADNPNGQAGIKITNDQSQSAQFGIGLYNYGIVANELIPIPSFFILPSDANQAYGTTGGNPLPLSEIGNGYTDANGNQIPSAGSGVLNDFLGSLAGGLAAGLLNNAKKQKQMYAVLCGTIDSVDDDYFVMDVNNSNDTVSVAKLVEARRVTYHDQTIDSITYDYDNPTTSANDRQAEDASMNTEDQELVPPYTVGDDVCAIITNGTGVDDANGDEIVWLELGSRLWMGESC